MSNLNDEAIFDFFSTLLKDDQGQRDAVKPLLFCEGPLKEGLDERRTHLVEYERKPIDREKLSMLLSPVGDYEAKAEIDKGVSALLPESHNECIPSSLNRGHVSKSLMDPKENTSSVDISDNIDVEQSDVSQRCSSVFQIEARQNNKEKDVFLSDNNQGVGLLYEQLEEDFQVLFFELSGLILAVPLLDLGGIINVNCINSIVGRPYWYLGTQAHRGKNVNLVDTFAWVMPEKRAICDKTNKYKYIALLGESQWGLAFHRVVKTGQLTKSQIQWRNSLGKRPWLAGIVKEQMCVILNVKMFISILNQELSCQGSN